MPRDDGPNVKYLAIERKMEHCLEHFQSLTNEMRSYLEEIRELRLGNAAQTHQQVNFDSGPLGDRGEPGTNRSDNSRGTGDGFRRQPTIVRDIGVSCEIIPTGVTCDMQAREIRGWTDAIHDRALLAAREEMIGVLEQVVGPEEFTKLTQKLPSKMATVPDPTPLLSSVSLTDTSYDEDLLDPPTPRSTPLPPQESASASSVDRSDELQAAVKGLIDSLMEKQPTPTEEVELPCDTHLVLVSGRRAIALPASAAENIRELEGLRETAVVLKASPKPKVAKQRFPSFR